MTPRRARVWTVADFVRHVYGGEPTPAKKLRARRWLLRLNRKHGGRLLIPSEGTNREYTLLPAMLARLEPELFKPIESLEFRVDELEEELSEVKATQRRTISQVGQNSRDIARMRTRSSAA